ncbi:S-formylglutathione hydrolase FrmB [Herbihabitans rhizosphaerae]|uniref:Acyl-CoA:diacylglycerol acyltransferase n=1 Tax=Herbihabitans rhizosphaerae TaxID=1872711 RepID=A0A4V2EU53_9PSEU|nr:alpha/beta hydrolase-fold protein [Herbihabitans rhizosphaerae]RZS43373.1 S-formylglutathione hydrolase FrmB [Herbihabitans rhizosphaerae]
MGKVGRRALLAGALGLGVTGLVGTGMVTDVLPGGAAARRALGMTGTDGTVPDVPPGPVSVRRVYSAARGREVEIVHMGPSDVDGSRLPVCLALHGRGGGARWFADLGLPRFLTAAVRAGVRPFAVVAVDGGDSYFVRSGHDDPQRMLADEVPAWLGADPFAVLGISMGGFGALRLARTRRDLRAVAVASPALFGDWSDAKGRNGFESEQRWADNEPLRYLNEITGSSLGVWCGTEDPFADAARELVEGARPASSSIDSGEHDDGYWLRVLPDMLRFVGARV